MTRLKWLALNASPATSNSSLFRRTGVIVFFVVLLLSIPQAALLPLLDRDEPRFAEASREMIQSGNMIVPTFNHAPRYAKPPLIYWCQAVSFKIFGEYAFAARFPSLLATAGTALLLFWWGSRLGYKTVGLIAAFSYAFCLQTVQQGRVATADALLIFFMTLTGFAGWNLVHLGHEPKSPETTRDWNRWGCWLVLGFAGGFLAKGPEALLPLIALVTGISSLGLRVIQACIAMFLLALLIVAAWAIPAFILTHGDYWREGMSEGVGERMVTGLQGHGASSFGWYLLLLPLYLAIFWLSALPWSPLLLIQRRKLFVGMQADRTDRYLILNSAVIFIVFSLMVTKLPHYTLPAFPFIALLFARRWVIAGLNPWLPIRLTVGFGIGFALFAILFVPVALLNHGSPSPVAKLVEEGDLPPDTEIAMVDFQEPNAVWELRRSVRGYATTIPDSDVLSYLQSSGPRAVVLTTDLWERLDLGRDSGDSSLKIYKARGFNAAKGNFIDLTLVVKK